ncbi:MAG: hypothetical protein EOP20_05475 [Hyphomicrobiales bacterium]|nr:MAG: hypothetical protein EOP20_05475 [Hyphomicrobiales bacterium]
MALQEAGPSGRAARNNGRGERRDGQRERRGETMRPSGEVGEFVAPLAETSNVAMSSTDVEGSDTPLQQEADERRGRSRDRYGRERRERTARADDAPLAIEAVSEPESGTIGSTSEPSREPAHHAEPATSVAEGAALAIPAANGRTLPKVQPFELPLAQLAQVAEGSGLHWVNSDAERIAQARAAIEAEPRPVHVPRVRAPAIVVDDVALVLVETRRDMKNMSLPSERSI